MSCLGFGRFFYYKSYTNQSRWSLKTLHWETQANLFTWEKAALSCLFCLAIWRSCCALCRRHPSPSIHPSAHVEEAMAALLGKGQLAKQDHPLGYIQLPQYQRPSQPELLMAALVRALKTPWALAEPRNWHFTGEYSCPNTCLEKQTNSTTRMHVNSSGFLQFNISDCTAPVKNLAKLLHFEGISFHSYYCVYCFWLIEQTMPLIAISFHHSQRQDN